jgi:hypothetical protein
MPRVRGRVAGLRLVAFFGAVIVIGCRSEPQIDARVWRLMRCIECQEGEEAAVVSMGVSAIPGLRQFLLEGPPDTTVARQDSALSAPLSGGSPTGAAPQPPSGGNPTRVAPQPPAGRGGRPTQPPAIVVPATQLPAGYVQARIDDFVAMYRVRSSLALGLIGGESARKALCEGKAMQFRPDVQRMIDSSLVLLNGTCP